jgi:uncharacterized protein (UPF0276 family)
LLPRAPPCATRESMTRASLPWRGLGLSSNLDASDVPHPYRLLDASPGLFDYVEYSAPLSLEQAQQEASLFPEMWARREQVPVLFHPVHVNLWGPELESPEALAHLDAHAKAVGSSWVGNDLGWWHSHGQAFPGYMFIAPPLSEAGLADCVAHAEHVQAHLSVPLVLENPPVFARRGPLHVLDFMARLHARTRAPLLLDLGHLLSFQLAAGLSPTTGLDGFPLEAVVEVHLAGGVITEKGGRATYVDDHTQPVREELFGLLEALLPRLPSLRAVTFEGDGHPEEVAALTLKRLRRLVPQGPRPALALEQMQGHRAPYTPQTRPWELFTQVHTGEGGEDEAGLKAERDFRLAVLAERLDVHMPLTRLLVAGTREGLAAFAASEDYRAVFAQGGREVEEAFAAWTRRQVRERGGEHLAPVLAFETAASHATHHVPPPPRPGELALSPEVRVMDFPVDLTELVFAARALKRHLSGRGWACGEVEHSGLSTLEQVVRRSPVGTWRCALQRRGRGWEVVTLSPEQAQALHAASTGLPLTELEQVAPAETWRELRRRGWLRLASGG